MARWRPQPRPEMPSRLETFREWEWDGDKGAWVRARVEWMRENMTTKEIAREMERRRVERRREMESRWRERLED